jgi:hypothetical protein
MEALIVDVYDDELCFPSLSYKFPSNTIDALKPQPSIYKDLVKFGRVLIDAGEFKITNELLKGGIPIQAKYYGIRNWTSELNNIPYAIHTGFELPLLLSGRKKLGWLNIEPWDGEFENDRRACFERCVAQGILGKQEDLFESERGKVGTIYYFPIDEAWRVPSLQLIRKASGECGGWNEVFERMEGMLMGYGKAENDAWNAICLESGNPSLGMSICCLLDNEELSFVRNSGLNSLPWNIDTDLICFRNVNYHEDSLRTLLKDHGKCAVVRCWISYPKFLKVAKIEISPGAWKIAKSQIPLLNSLFKRKLFIVYENGCM